MTKTRVHNFTNENPESTSQKSKHAVSEVVSISGIKQIFGEGTSHVRRTIWFVLLLAGMSSLVYQVYTTITYYLSGPTIQTTSTVYRQDVPFPAVTICNQNTIRISHTFTRWNEGEESAEREPFAYESVSELMTLLNERTAWLDKADIIQMFPVGHNFTPDIFYYQSGHTLENMIKSCVFNGMPCRSEWFTPLLTDAGLCYTFNGGNTVGGLRTALRGRNGGLSLELNVEQYEYTKSRTNTAGVYLLIQDQSEIPNLVLNTALAVSSGYHTSIALSLRNRTSYQDKHERCGSSMLTSFPSGQPYTRSACELDGLTRYINDTCKCIYYYMPGYRDVHQEEKCDIMRTISCVLPQTDSFPTNANYSKYCQCKTPCQITSYQTAVSQVQISDLAANLFVSEGKFGTEVFAQYLMGMMFRDWVILRGTGSTELVDAVHGMVYNSITPLREAYNALVDSKEEMHLVPIALSCESNKSQQYCQEDVFSTLETLSKGFKGDRPLSQWFRPQLFIQSVELNVDLAHKLLRNSKYETTLMAQLGRNCSAAVSVLDQVLTAITVNWKQTCANTSEVNLVLQVLTATRDLFDKALESVQNEKHSYDILLRKVSATLGKWYSPWNEKGLDAKFYRDNYGSVDIFYPEIKVTQTTEKSAYDAVAMLCDTGGALGLCLGGSLLTVFEVVDFFLGQFFCCVP